MGSGNSGHEKPGTTVWAEHGVSPNDDAEAAGDLGHGGEKWKRAAGELNRLVGNRRDLCREQRLGEVFLRCEVKISEEKHSLAEISVFALDWFFDLEDRVPGSPHGGGVLLNKCTLR